jgi:hypothetical protein
MRSPASTVIVVVGDASDEILNGLARLPNVQTAQLREPDAPPPRDVIAAAHTPYIVHDADPLEHVASAWVEFFDDRSTLGTLDVEVETVLGAFTRGDAVMPDYYLVLDPEALEGTWKHWWLGVLAGASPRRVLPSAPTVSAVRRILRALPAGRAWPEMSTWLPHLKFELPDRAGLTPAGGGGAT